MLACTDLLGVDEDVLNADGGALALGHAYGASGAVSVVRLLARPRPAGGQPAAGDDQLRRGHRHRRAVREALAVTGPARGVPDGPVRERARRASGRRRCRAALARDSARAGR
ncbi:hypothetical protein [Kocuria sp. CNJ-770]|uniref:hypothetical protein n=1 Tax=Kocuria sp. CNJ-770 TaxID=1904964 RepID=UPI003512D154